MLLSLFSVDFTDSVNVFDRGGRCILKTSYRRNFINDIYGVFVSENEEVEHGEVL